MNRGKAPFSLGNQGFVKKIGPENEHIKEKGQPEAGDLTGLAPQELTMPYIIPRISIRNFIFHKGFV